MRRLATMCALALIPGCSDSGPLRPPELHLGEDPCAVCGMAVSDGRYAAAIVLRDRARDRVFLLDDLGELPQVALPPHDELAMFVRDEQTQAWIPAHLAHYIQSDEIRTPMGFGIAAFATSQAASERGRALGARALGFDALRPGTGP